MNGAVVKLSGAAIAVMVALLGGTVAACAHDGAPAASEPRTHHGNPFANGPVYRAVDPAATRAAKRATGDDKAILTRFAKVPAAVWLTPEAYPASRVGATVAKVVAAADAAKRTPFFVVYGITDRDCSTQESLGGLDPTAYAGWVKKIAAATDEWTAVVLEPDALASAPQCDPTGALSAQRERLLAAAVHAFAARRASVYLDAGHADWVSAADMTTLLERSDIAQARGFALNTSFFDVTSSERAYAGRLRQLLGDSAHYLVDTSRNGNGGNGEFCNPRGRALGVTPRLVGAGGQDASLWIKPPGESDGHCNGGPAAGTWWTTGALALARNAGW